LLVDDAGGVVLNAVHLGIGARATQLATPLKPRLGRFAFPIGALAAGFRTRGWRIDVHIDGRIVADTRSPVLMVTLSNGPTIGGGLAQPQPDAVPDDGMVDVVVSRAVGPLARVGFAVDLSRGTHLTRSDSHVARGRQVTVVGEPFLTVADGEVDGPTTERAWTLEPSAWQMSVPQRTNPPPRRKSQEAAEP
jgi:diacylglycerol kinase (ATP)